MRAIWIPVLALFVGGCAYVSKDEFDQYWDEDEDGWGIGEDCAPNDDRIYPFAPDVRGDGCDSDCGREPDADNDDWPDDADCAPNDPEIYPCNLDELPGDGVDSDCDGEDGVRTLECPDTDPDNPDAEAISNCPDSQVTL